MRVNVNIPSWIVQLGIGFIGGILGSALFWYVLLSWTAGDFW